MNTTLEEQGRYGDILGALGFALLVYYLYSKKQRSTLENILLVFAIGGFAVDSILTINRFVLAKN